MITSPTPPRRPRRERRTADPLGVRTETLHRLQDTDLARVAGGTGRGTVAARR